MRSQVRERGVNGNIVLYAKHTFSRELPLGTDVFLFIAIIIVIIIICVCDLH